MSDSVSPPTPEPPPCVHSASWSLGTDGVMRCAVCAFRAAAAPVGSVVSPTRPATCGWCGDEDCEDSLCEIAQQQSDEIDHLRAVLERMQPVVDAAQRAHPKQCPRSGHWRPCGVLTEADRPEQFADPRTRRIDCSDDQCQNRDHIRFIRCDHSWHDMDDALAAVRRYQETPKEDA